VSVRDAPSTSATSVRPVRTPRHYAPLAR
jgi:hypothetical protein